jgi:hypothetical protein
VSAVAGPEDRTPLPPGAVAYDVSGRTIMPGLVEGNSHIIFSGQSDHLRYFVERADRYYEIGARNLYTSLMQGITTTRDTMDPLEEMLRLRGDVLGAPAGGGVRGDDRALDVGPVAEIGLRNLVADVEHDDFFLAGIRLHPLGVDERLGGECGGGEERQCECQ